MTVKEKLYKEYVSVKNMLNALEGKGSIGGADVEAYSTTYNFSCAARRYSKSELINMIDCVKGAYDRKLEEARIEEYYATEEGKVVKESLTSQIKDITEQRHNLIMSATKDVDAFIKEWLGTEWGCRTVGSSSTEIGMIESEKDGVVNFYFGHSFTLYYNDYFFKDKFELNYGAMGAFAVLDNSGVSERHCKYLFGMGTFVNDKAKLAELKNKIMGFCNANDVYTNRINILRAKLKNPLNEKRAE